ncbi:MAG TPA: PAS domain S-box protein, partial [Candidatus Sulfotelmatobacter sp.]|nr:PAS domain S-box protein [Candidatus Sulfotelmatobacter sp.]
MTIRSSRTRREQFFSLSLDMLAIASFDGYLLDLNPRWTQVLGWSIDELQSHPFLDFVHPDDKSRTAAEMDRIVSGAQTVRWESRWQCKDSSYRWLSWSASPDPNERCFYAVARDITDDKRSQEQLRVVTQGALDAVVTTDEEGTITSWSPLAEALFGWSAEEAVQQKLASLILPRRFRNAYARSLARYRASILGPVPGRVLQLHGVRKDGSEFP